MSGCDDAREDGSLGVPGEASQALSLAARCDDDDDDDDFFFLCGVPPLLLLHELTLVLVLAQSWPPQCMRPTADTADLAVLPSETESASWWCRVDARLLETAVSLSLPRPLSSPHVSCSAAR